MSKITIEEFAKQFGIKEDELCEFIQVRQDEIKRKSHYNEIQNELRSLVEKYKNQFIKIDSKIIRITDIITEFGKFVIRGVGFDQFDTMSGLNSYVLTKCHFSIPLINTTYHDAEDVDKYLEDRILSEGTAHCHINDCLTDLGTYLNDTFFNKEYIPDFSDF